MRKHISQGKFKRVCDMPDTELLIATKIVNRPRLTMWHSSIRVEGDQDFQVTLIARNKGLYYFLFKDWDGNENHYRSDSLPSNLGVVTGLSMLKNRGGRVEITRPIDCCSLFSAKIELL